MAITYEEAIAKLSLEEQARFKEELETTKRTEGSLVFLLDFLLLRRQFMVTKRGSGAAYSHLLTAILDNVDIYTIQEVPSVANGELLLAGCETFDLLLDIYKENIANIQIVLRTGESEPLLSHVIKCNVDSYEAFIEKLIGYCNLESVKNALDTVLAKGTKLKKLRKAATDRHKALATPERRGSRFGWLSPKSPSSPTSPVSAASLQPAEGALRQGSGGVTPYSSTSALVDMEP